MSKSRVKRKQHKQPAPARTRLPSQRSLIWMLSMAGAAVVVIALAWATRANPQADTPQTAERSPRTALNAEAKPAADTSEVSTQPPLGLVTECQRNPAFADALGFGQIGINTTGNLHRGLMLFDASRNDISDGDGIYRHETWDDGGYLGIHTVDRSGNIYVAPWPKVDLRHNPLAARNRLYQVDAERGVLTEFAELPEPKGASQANPFGTASLTYDCDTHSLYASSVAGSTPREPKGRIFRIDLSTKEIFSQSDGFDAFGLTIFNGTNGKRLYFGSARAGDVFSIALDSMGDFLGEARFEFSVDDLPNGAGQVVRRLKVSHAQGSSESSPYTLRVDLMKFNFNLVPPAGRQRTSYTFGYDLTTDHWLYQGMVQ